MELENLASQSLDRQGIDAARRIYAVFKVRWGLRRFGKLHRLQWSKHSTRSRSVGIA
jgi:hypothetical protein